MCGQWREAGHGTPYLQHHRHDKLTPEDEGRRESGGEEGKRGEKGERRSGKEGGWRRRQRERESRSSEGREEREEDKYKAIEGSKEKKEQIGKLMLQCSMDLKSELT